MTNEQEHCPYCGGVKRIRDDLVHYTRRSILEIKHGNQLWSKFILPNNEYEVMAYIRFCPMCGRDLFTYWGFKWWWQQKN